MRLTCLKCGHQFETETGPQVPPIRCVCGLEFENIGVVNTGCQPSSAAGERSRAKAFRAAGITKNVGGFALGIAALGVLFFPLGLIGAAVGVYCLTMLRGAVGRYSGRSFGVAAIFLGVAIFVIEGRVALSWLEERRTQELLEVQRSVGEDLKTLRRAAMRYHADNEKYGGFKDFRFRPPNGRYTIYLGPDDYHPAVIAGEEHVEPLPKGLSPGAGPDNYTAVAVANLDSDDDVDVWVMTAMGDPLHEREDLDIAVRELEALKPAGGAHGAPVPGNDNGDDEVATEDAERAAGGSDPRTQT